MKGEKLKTERITDAIIVGRFLSLTVPVAQLMLGQPFVNDAGHLHNIRQVMQKDMIVSGDGERMESSLQTT